MTASTLCARNLPQHFNGCTCTASASAAEADVALTSSAASLTAGEVLAVARRHAGLAERNPRLVEAIACAERVRPGVTFTGSEPASRDGREWLYLRLSNGAEARMIHRGNEAFVEYGETAVRAQNSHPDQLLVNAIDAIEERREQGAALIRAVEAIDLADAPGTVKHNYSRGGLAFVDEVDGQRRVFEISNVGYRFNDLPHFGTHDAPIYANVHIDGDESEIALYSDGTFDVLDSETYSQPRWVVNSFRQLWAERTGSRVDPAVFLAHARLDEPTPAMRSAVER